MNKALLNNIPTGADPAQTEAIELVCPVDTLVQLRAAVDNGADSVQLRFSAKTGQDSHTNFKAMASGIRYAHDRRCRVTVRLHESARDAISWCFLRKVIDEAAAYGVDALELTDHALMLYVVAHHPQMQLHYAVERIDVPALDIVKHQFDVSRLTLPRLISTAELIRLTREATMELQLHGFCRFSSVARTNDLLDAAAQKREGSGGTKKKQQGNECGNDQCATAAHAANDHCFSEQQTVGLEVLQQLPQLSAIGIRAILIEAHGSRPNQTAHITRIWREAIDECLENTDRYTVRPSWVAELNKAAMQLRSR